MSRAALTGWRHRLRERLRQAVRLASTAEMAKLLGLPVTLVIDASAMARSAAALIHGFVGFDHKLRIAGVILNNVGGEALAEIIREAVADDVAILGAIPHAPTSACLSATWASTCRARPGGTEPSG